MSDLEQARLKVISAIHSGDTEMQKAQFSAYQTIAKGDSATSILVIKPLELTTDTILCFGKVDVPVSLRAVSGKGSLKVINSEFTAPLTIQHLTQYQGSEIIFEGCSFSSEGLTVRDSSLSATTLRFIGNNPNDSINVTLGRCRLKSLIVKNHRIPSLSLDDDVEIQKIGVLDCDLSCRLLRGATNVKGLKTLIVRNSIFNEVVELNQGKGNLDFNIYLDRVSLMCDVLSPNQHVFSKTVAIRRCTISRDAKIDLRELTFRKRAKVHFSEGDKINFAGCNFDGPSVIRIENVRVLGFKSCNFDGVSISLREVSDVDLSGTNFRKDAHFEQWHVGRVSFYKSTFQSYASFKKSKFFGAPDFLNAQFTHYTTFQGCQFYDVQSNESEGRYRILKEHMKEISNDNDEALFSSYELQSRRKDLYQTDKIEWACSWIYWMLNKYGRSIIQPIGVIIGTWIFFVLIFFVTDSFFIEPKPILTSSSGPILEAKTVVKLPVAEEDLRLNWVERTRGYTKLGKAAVFSGINMLGPLRLVSQFEQFKVSNFWFVLVTWGQSIIATILWYLFIVGVKRRFRTG